MPLDNSPPVKQGDISHAVERSHESVLIDLARFNEKTDIIIKQNARQWWVMLTGLITTFGLVVVATAAIVTFANEWKWYKRNVIRWNEFTYWSGKTESLNADRGIHWRAAEMPRFASDDK
jgi:hypothetical protein